MITLKLGAGIGKVPEYILRYGTDYCTAEEHELRTLREEGWNVVSKKSEDHFENKIIVSIWTILEEMAEEDRKSF